MTQRLIGRMGEAPAGSGLIEMKILKNDFVRLFAIGFLVGGIAVAGTLELGLGSSIAHEVMPAAVAAAPAR